MARNDRLQLKQLTEEDLVSLAGSRTWGGVFEKAYKAINGGRAVVIILDPYCVRWMGYARGIELNCLGKKEAKSWELVDLTTTEAVKQDGWTPVNGRHEFKNGNEARCIRNALRWVNHTATWIYAR